MENLARLVSAIFPGHTTSTKSLQLQEFTSNSPCQSRTKCNWKDLKRNSQLSLSWNSIFWTDSFMGLFQLSLKSLKSSRKRKRKELFMRKQKSMKRKFDIWKWWRNLILSEIFHIKRNLRIFRWSKMKIFLTKSPIFWSLTISLEFQRFYSLVIPQP